MQQLEPLLSVRQPTEEDLRQVCQGVYGGVCSGCVVVAWGRGGGVGRTGCLPPCDCPVASHLPTWPRPFPFCFLCPSLQLFSNLKVTWSASGAVVSNRREDQSTFSADLNKITGELEQVGGWALGGRVSSGWVGERVGEQVVSWALAGLVRDQQACSLAAVLWCSAGPALHLGRLAAATVSELAIEAPDQGWQ